MESRIPFEYRRLVAGDGALTGLRPELEELAVDTYRRFRKDPSEPLSSTQLARLMLGPGRVLYGPAGMTSEGAAVTLNGERRVYIRPGLSPQRQSHVVVHEASHIFWGTKDEDFCNYIAAALLAPAPAIRRALGLSIRQMAEVFRVTQTLAALREAEVTGRPRIVLARSHQWVRGSWSVPAQEALTLPGLRKTRLTDAPKRYVIDAG